MYKESRLRYTKQNRIRVLQNKSALITFLTELTSLLCTTSQQLKHFAREIK